MQCPISSPMNNYIIWLLRCGRSRVTWLRPLHKILVCRQVFREFHARMCFLWNASFTFLHIAIAGSGPPNSMAEPSLAIASAFSLRLTPKCCGTNLQFQDLGKSGIIAIISIWSTEWCTSSYTYPDRILCEASAAATFHSQRNPSVLVHNGRVRWTVWHAKRDVGPLFIYMCGGWTK